MLPGPRLADTNSRENGQVPRSSTQCENGQVSTKSACPATIRLEVTPDQGSLAPHACKRYHNLGVQVRSGISLRRGDTGQICTKPQGSVSEHMIALRSRGMRRRDQSSPGSLKLIKTVKWPPNTPHPIPGSSTHKRHWPKCRLLATARRLAAPPRLPRPALPPSCSSVGHTRSRRSPRAQLVAAAQESRCNASASHGHDLAV